MHVWGAYVCMLQYSQYILQRVHRKGCGYYLVPNIMSEKLTPKNKS